LIAKAPNFILPKILGGAAHGGGGKAPKPTKKENGPETPGRLHLDQAED
jgi:hypothetical protein